jgi:hypothetical protein
MEADHITLCHEVGKTADLLALHCQDADKLDDLGEKWEIDVLDLMDKIKDLTAAQVDAVYFRVEQFWNSEDKDLEEFSQF